MKAFLKENSDLIRKLVVYQIGLIIFSTVITMAVAKSSGLVIAASVFSIAFYWFLLYNATWHAGQKDEIKITQGRMQFSPQKGFLVAMVANALNLLLALWVPISRIFVLPDGSTFSDYLFLNDSLLPVSPEWIYNLYSIPRWIINIFQIMYAGVYKAILPFNPFSYLIGLLCSMLICMIGYILGTKNFSIFSITQKDSK